MQPGHGSGAATRRVRGFVLLLVVVAAPAAGCLTDAARSDDVIVLATTTSMRDSGLLDVLLPAWEARSGWDVDVIAVGTGAALDLGRRGDADVLIVHAPAAELEFMDEGHAVNRTTFAWNRFVLVGPTEDPADLAQASNVSDALLRIVELAEGDEDGVIFSSRGDRSGTHQKEERLWAEADALALATDRPAPGLTTRDGGEYPGGDWYESVGQGMGALLTMADERRTHALCDRGTWLHRADQLDLLAHPYADAELVNPYSVLQRPVEALAPDVATMAADFAGWLLGEEAVALIEGHTVAGEPLFTAGAPPA